MLSKKLTGLMHAKEALAISSKEGAMKQVKDVLDSIENQSKHGRKKIGVSEDLNDEAIQMLRDLGYYVHQRSAHRRRNPDVGFFIYWDRESISKAIHNAGR